MNHTWTSSPQPPPKKKKNFIFLFNINLDVEDRRSSPIPSSAPKGLKERSHYLNIMFECVCVCTYNYMYVCVYAWRQKANQPLGGRWTNCPRLRGLTILSHRRRPCWESPIIIKLVSIVWILDRIDNWRWIFIFFKLKYERYKNILTVIVIVVIPNLLFRSLKGFILNLSDFIWNSNFSVILKDKITLL